VIDWEQKEEYLHFAESALNVKFRPGETTWLASLDSSGQLLGVVVYTTFTEWGCEMSVAAASPKFLNSSTLKSFFGYPFLQLQHSRVTAIVAASNQHSLDFVQRLGFKPEGLLRKWYGDQDGHIFGMLKEECKWVSPVRNHRRLLIQ
jgi:RimJ/RimL family protein N-acetyltransferase